MKDHVKMVADWEDIGTAIPLQELASKIDEATPIVLGRAVHYRSRGSADGKYDSRCVAAIVTAVEGFNYLGLAVLNPTGLFFHSGSPHDSAKFEGGSWHRLSDCIFEL
jgi:hypothetical protein